MAADYYPIAIRLKTRRVLVIGGGKVAERKIRTLVDAGARAKVISPDLTPALRRMVRRGIIRWVARTVRRSDIYRADIVIAATSDSKVNRKISLWSKKQKALVNVVDNPGSSDFISPALLRKRGIVIAVYTDGKKPVLSRDLKNFLKERWDEFLSFRSRP